MKKILVLLTILLFLLVGAAAWAQAAEPEAPADAVDEIIIAEPEIEIIVLEDGTEEIQEILPASARPPRCVDEDYLAIKVAAQQQIDAILEQIENLDDRSDESELHREIERIKKAAEVERLVMLQEKAEAEGNLDLADEMAEEIAHLEKIDQPAARVSQDLPSEQPIPSERR